MNKDTGDQLKSANPNEALGLIGSLLNNDRSGDWGVNSWLYLYEILYAQTWKQGKGELKYAEAAISILSHLENKNSSDMNSFLVQELTFRARLIKTHGVGNSLLDPEYIFSEVKFKLDIFNPEDIPKNWQDLKTRKEIVKLRNIKNILGPISLLKDIGIEKDFFTNWLLVRGQLPYNKRLWFQVNLNH